VLVWYGTRQSAIVAHLAHARSWKFSEHLVATIRGCCGCTRQNHWTVMESAHNTIIDTEMAVKTILYQKWKRSLKWLLDTNCESKIFTIKGSQMGFHFMLMYRCIHDEYFHAFVSLHYCVLVCV